MLKVQHDIALEHAAPGGVRGGLVHAAGEGGG